MFVLFFGGIPSALTLSAYVCERSPLCWTSQG